MSKNIHSRQVAVDIETTGLDPTEGHRIIAIAAVELIDRCITGESISYYVNPPMNIDSEVEAITGISNEFLKNKPPFTEIAGQLVEFLSGAELLAHNAPFDINFLNAELGLSGLERVEDICPNVVDTLQLARALRPQQNNSLDALCNDYGIKYESTVRAGVLMDANLVARIYLAISPPHMH